MLDDLKPHRKKGSAFRYEWERAVRDSDLSPRTKHFLLTLGTFLDIDGTNAYPGTGLLARSMSVDKQTVKRARRDALLRSFIVKDREGMGNTSILYRAVLPPHLTALGGVADVPGDTDVPTPGDTDDPQVGSQVTTNQISYQTNNHPTLGDGLYTTTNLAVFAFDEWGITDPGIRRRYAANARQVAEICGTEAAVSVFLKWAREDGCRGPGGWTHFLSSWSDSNERESRREASRRDQQATDECDLCTIAGWRLDPSETGQDVRCTHESEAASTGGPVVASAEINADDSDAVPQSFLALQEARRQLGVESIAKSVGDEASRRRLLADEVP